VTLTTLNYPIFDILYRIQIFVETLRVEIETLNLVDMLIVASASPRMANHL